MTSSLKTAKQLTLVQSLDSWRNNIGLGTCISMTYWRATLVVNTKKSNSTTDQSTLDYYIQNTHRVVLSSSLLELYNIHTCTVCFNMRRVNKTHYLLLAIKSPTPTENKWVIVPVYTKYTTLISIRIILSNSLLRKNPLLLAFIFDADGNGMHNRN